MLSLCGWSSRSICCVTASLYRHSYRSGSEALCASMESHGSLLFLSFPVFTGLGGSGASLDRFLPDGGVDLVPWPVDYKHIRIIHLIHMYLPPTWSSGLSASSGENSLGLLYLVPFLVHRVGFCGFGSYTLCPSSFAPEIPSSQCSRSLGAESELCRVRFLNDVLGRPDLLESVIVRPASHLVKNIC